MFTGKRINNCLCQYKLGSIGSQLGKKKEYLATQELRTCKATPSIYLSAWLVLPSCLPEANFVERELDLLFKVAQILHGE